MKWCVYFGLYSAWHRQMSGTSTGAYNFKIRDGISELYIEWMENMIYAKVNTQYQSLSYEIMNYYYFSPFITFEFTKNQLSSIFQTADFHAI